MDIGLGPRDGPRRGARPKRGRHAVPPRPGAEAVLGRHRPRAAVRRGAAAAPDPMVVRLCYLLGISSAIRSYLLTARGLLQGLDRFDLEAAIVVADRVAAARLRRGRAVRRLRPVSGWASRSSPRAALMLVVVTLVLQRVDRIGRADLRPRRVAGAAGGGAAARPLHDRAQHVHVHRHRYTRLHAHRRRDRLVQRRRTACTRG